MPNPITIQQRLRASIVIVSYNGASYLDRCLSSLYQNCGDTCEIIIVDNNSTDNSADIVSQRFPEVVLVRNMSNQGFAAACNAGAAIARGKYLVFLNQDTQVMPGWLDALLQPLENDQTIGLTTSKILLMSQPDYIHICGQDVHFTGLIFERGLMAPALSMTDCVEVGAVSGASFALSQELWDRLGGFDEQLFMYYEETDLCWRARLLGYKLVYVPASIVYHDYHPSLPSFGRLYYSMRNRYIMLLKNWDYRTLLLLMPGIIIAELSELALAFKYGSIGMRAKMKSYIWLVAQFRCIMRARNRTQTTRKVMDANILVGYTYCLRPKIVTGGKIGDIIVYLLNIALFLNYCFARSVCYLGNW